MSDKRKYKKDSFTEKKRKHGTEGKRTQMPVTIIEGLAATDKGEGRWLFLYEISVTDVSGILNATLSEKLSTTGVIES